MLVCSSQKKIKCLTLLIFLLYSNKTECIIEIPIWNWHFEKFEFKQVLFENSDKFRQIRVCLNSHSKFIEFLFESIPKKILAISIRMFDSSWNVIERVRFSPFSRGNSSESFCVAKLFVGNSYYRYYQEIHVNFKFYWVYLACWMTLVIFIFP